MKWFRTTQIEREKPWHAFADLCCKVSDTESFWVRIYEWREDRPEVYSAGPRPCLPYVLHHATPIERPDVVAAIPPAETWAELPLLGSYQDLHPENCHPVTWQKPLR